MLEKLFGSKARARLLKHFLLNSDQEFYIRQLARDLDLQVNSVRRELNNLEDFGLLSSTGNDSTKNDDLSNDSKVSGLQERKYYRVRTDFILYSEIKSLIIKSQILAGESFIEKLKTVGEPQFILLSGLFVNNPSSPTDVLIVAKIKKEHLLKIINDLEFDLGREINFTVMDEEEFKYRQEVADVFLHSVLNSRKIILLDKILDPKK
ncbi:MAG: hypothetical protein ACOXZ1_02435 [Patescibacteria group bacterium]|jgi:hypothetical protein